MCLLWLVKTKQFGKTKESDMKIYLAQGESRNFSFSAIAETEAEAEHAIIETFKAHARQYDLPTNWWVENADYFIMEMEVGRRYRDQSPLNSKWSMPTELTDEDLDNGLNICDCCERKDKSIDMFWSVGECETDRQRQAMQFMEKNGYEIICQECFENLNGDF